LLLVFGGISVYFGVLTYYIIVLLMISLGGMLYYSKALVKKQVTVKDIEVDELMEKGKLEFEKVVEKAKRFKISNDYDSAVKSYDKAMEIYEWLVKKQLDEEDASLLFSRLGELKKEIEK